MTDHIGQQFGNYHLLRLLGSGGFAEVYLGEHLYLERPAAIKVLHVQMEPKVQEAFLREARTIAHLDHPHIVRVLDFGIEGQTPYLVMDYTPNGTLRTRHPKGTRLSFEQIVLYVKQIASALDYAHEQHVIHRDVKPENILLNAKGNLVLSDFGIAVMQRTLSPSTQTMAGTPLYIAPEQIQGHPCPASDQYALAVMVYEWLCGEPPFPGPGLAAFGQHLFQDPPSLLARVPELTRAVEDTVFGALARDPARRFATMQDFALALEEACFATQPLSISVSTEHTPQELDDPTLTLPTVSVSHPPPAMRPTMRPAPSLAGQQPSFPVSVLCVCAPEDQMLLEQWEAHLRPLEQSGTLRVWSAYHLLAGVSRLQQINQHLDQADLIVLLLSADFFPSNECIALMQRALRLQQRRGVHLVPLLLRPVEWQASPLASLACLPSNGIPVTEWANRDAAFDACARDICQLLGRLMPPVPHPQPALVLSPAARRNRLTLLHKVRSIWIDGVLSHSLHGAALIALGLAAQPDAVADPWQLVLQHPEETPYPLPAGTHISKIYDEACGELLILGAPGAGKTTLLLELARELLVRAEADESLPMPVVFHLSSWASEQLPLQDWLVKELRTRYYIPRKLALALLSAEQILPLLDGLDEVAVIARTACIETINAFRQEHGLLPLVVCSRSADYLSQSIRIQLRTAVTIQPLTPQQVDAYLASGKQALHTLRFAWHHDPALRELTSSPLMLSLVVLAYQGVSPAELIQHGSLAERQHQIFEHYVTRVLQRSGPNHRHYSAEQTRCRLSWLARQLSQRHQAVFYIEQLQPDWLPNRFLRWLYTALAVKSVDAFIGLLVGILGSFIITGIVSGVGIEVYAPVGVIIGLFTRRGYKLRSLSDSPALRWLNYVKISPLLIGMIITPLIASLATFVWHIYNFLEIEKSACLGGLIGLVIGILLSLRSTSIQPVEIVTWSWNKFIHMRHLFTGFFVSLSVGVLGWFFFSNKNYVLLYAFFAFIGGLLVSGLLSGLSNERLDDHHRIVPNQGIRYSARNGRRFGCLTGLACGLIYALIIKLIDDNIHIGMNSDMYAISYGIVSALGIGLLSWLFSGGDASIKHRVLRCLLWLAGVIPWRLSGFLDYTAECTLLCRVGGGYIFTHRLLLDYFSSFSQKSISSVSRVPIVKKRKG
jgi:serine/threonine protein kinase